MSPRYQPCIVLNIEEIYSQKSKQTGNNSGYAYSKPTRTLFLGVVGKVFLDTGIFCVQDGALNMHIIYLGISPAISNQQGFVAQNINQSGNACTGFSERLYSFGIE